MTEALTITRHLSEPGIMLAQLLTNMAFALCRTGDAAEGARCLLESLELIRVEDFQRELPPLILVGAEVALDADLPQT
ncbi:hypothetical protein, partial [Bradyrhizobium sp. NBAIM08]|uniref:hypothetical protein n=1 Tax=Bradyrhizobium sp. NBAIM08 TaxID=2793815 RepID=UPI001CD4073C